VFDYSNHTSHCYRKVASLQSSCTPHISSSWLSEFRSLCKWHNSDSELQLYHMQVQCRIQRRSMSEWSEIHKNYHFIVHFFPITMSSHYTGTVRVYLSRRSSRRQL
ncbi:hypothetical protein PFISCL1PPCAC_2221, partial [Pristionchus fissidentatus]